MWTPYKIPLFCLILLLACRNEEFEAIAPNPTAITQELVDLPTSSVWTKANGSVTQLAIFNNQLIAAGYFTEIGGINANGIAAYDGTGWNSLGNGFSPNANPLYEVAGLIEDIQEFEDELYVTGQFDGIGGVHSPNLARWDGQGWHPVGKGIYYGNFQGDFVSASWWKIGGFSLEVFNRELYIGGGSLDGKSILAKWDGNKVFAVIDYPDYASTIELITFQNSLYGGVLLSSTSTLARFDGFRWIPLRQRDENWEGMHVYRDKLYGPSGVWDGTQFESVSYPLNEVHIVTSVDDHLYIVGDNYRDVPMQTSSPPQYTSVMRWDGLEWTNVYQGSTGEWFYSIIEFRDDIYLSGGGSQDGGYIGKIILLE